MPPFLEALGVAKGPPSSFSATTMGTNLEDKALEPMEISGLVTNHTIPWTIHIAAAPAIFIRRRMVARASVRLLKKVLTEANLAPAPTNAASSIVSALLLLFIIVAALDQLGADTTSVIVLLGAAGLALQGPLQNFAAGVLMIVFRLFKVRDRVEVAGTSGMVEAINIFGTSRLSGDKREIIVTNEASYSGPITNYTARDTPRIDIIFGVGYQVDIPKAKERFRRIPNDDQRALTDPEPTVALFEWADSGVKFAVWPWVMRGDYWAARFGITTQVKLRFDAEGISIPFPQTDVHLAKAAQVAATGRARRVQGYWGAFRAAAMEPA